MNQSLKSDFPFLVVSPSGVRACYVIN